MFPGCKCSGSGDSDEDEMEGWAYEPGDVVSPDDEPSSLPFCARPCIRDRTDGVYEDEDWARDGGWHDNPKDVKEKDIGKQLQNAVRGVGTNTRNAERLGRTGNGNTWNAKEPVPLYQKPPSAGQQPEGAPSVVTRSVDRSRVDSQGYGAVPAQNRPQNTPDAIVEAADSSPTQGANMDLLGVMSMPTAILSSLTETNTRGYDDTQVTPYASPEPNFWPVQSTPTVPLPTEVLGPSKFTSLSADSLRDPPLPALPTFEGIPTADTKSMVATFGAAQVGTADFGRTPPTGVASPVGASTFGRPEFGGAPATMGASPLPTAQFGAV